MNPTQKQQFWLWFRRLAFTPIFIVVYRRLSAVFQIGRLPKGGRVDIHRPHRVRAFTLIELLVVITIIAILAGLLNRAASKEQIPNS